MYLGCCIYCNASVSNDNNAVAVDVFEVAHKQCVDKHIAETNNKKENETEALSDR